MGLDDERRAAGRWLDVRQAADELGISSDAVRKRIARRTIPSSKGEDGSVSVWLVAAGPGRDEDQPHGGTEAGRGADTAPTELVEELRDRISYLERQVEEEREARRRADTLMARLMERVPELEASPPQEPPDASESAREDAGGVEERAGNEGPQTTARRPWWIRWLGG